MVVLACTIGTVTQSAAGAVGTTGATEKAVAAASATAKESGTASIAPAKLAPGATTQVYGVTMKVDVVDDSSAGSRTTVAGNLEVTTVDGRRIATFRPTTASVADSVGSNAASLDQATQDSLALPFVLGANGTTEIWFDSADTNASRNVKRQLAEQLMHTQPGLSDSFGTFAKNDVSRSNAGGLVTFTERRKNSSYAALNLNSASSSSIPEISIEQTTSIDPSSGVVVASSDTEATVVTVGTQSNEGGLTRDLHQRATAVTDLTLLSSTTADAPKVDVDSMELSTTAAVASEEEIAASNRASTPTVAEALDGVQDGDVTPGDVNMLVAALSARPEEAPEIGSRLRAGTIPSSAGTAIATALATTRVAGAAALLAELVQAKSMGAVQSSMVSTIQMTGFSDPSLTSTLKGLPTSDKASLAAESKSAAGSASEMQLDRPEILPDCDDCPPSPGGGGTGTGTGTATPAIRLPFDKVWTYMVGSAAFGGELGAHINVTAPTLPDGHTGLTGLAEGWAKAHLFGASPELARGKVSVNTDTATAPYQHTLAVNLKVLGTTVYNRSESVPCTYDLSRSLYTGSVTFINVQGHYPLGPVVFSGGVSATGNLSVPLTVHLDGCGLPLAASAQTSIGVHAWVQGTVWGGVSFLGLIGGGIEVTGTALNTTIGADATINYNAINVPHPQITGRVHVGLDFQAFTIRIRAWIRILFWTRRWTIFEWSTPQHHYSLYDQFFGPRRTRVVVVSPSNVPVNQAYRTALTNGIDRMRSWYGGQLGATFSWDRTVENCAATQPDTYFENQPWPKVVAALANCFPGFNTAGTNWIVYADVDPACSNDQRIGAGLNGLTIMPRQDLRGLAGVATTPDRCGGGANLGVERWIGGAAHEAGHSFGLPHPAGCDDGLPTCDAGSVMWTGYLNWPQTYFSAAERTQLLLSPFIG